MSVPMSLEDLEKLKLFIDFVSANPTILNQPSLDFVKKFIEKFGGKVPEGEFKIPAGGKCPFSGDAGEKKEPAAEEPESEESDPDETGMDCEPESELELDMDANSDVDEEDTKVKQRKRRPTKRETATKAKMKKKTTKRKQRKVLKESIKAEPNSDLEADEQQLDIEDPLNPDSKMMFGTRTRRTCFKNEYVYDENLITKRGKLGKIAKRPRALICFENCKYKCSVNFDIKQRKILCAEYWSMDDIGKDEFLRKTIMLHKTRRLCLQKTERPRREFMCRYFLRTKNGINQGVCSVFYMSTLSLKPTRVKDVLATIWEQQKTIKQDQSVMQFDEERPEDEPPDRTDMQAEMESAIEAVIMPKPPTVRRKLDMSRNMRPAKCEEVRCRFNCTSKVSEAQRAKLCAAFWALDFKRRKDYLISHVQSHAIVTKTLAEFMKSNRPRSHQNHFFLRNEKGEHVRVCSRFFTATLSLGSNYISRTLRRSDPNTGTYIGDDMRGRKEPHNKTRPELREDVKRHIESYPTWVPNKRSKTSFLHSSLSVQRMFNEYKEKCIANGVKFVNSTYFRRVFRDDFRLAFLRPSAVSPQKIGTAKRNPLSSEKIKKIKAPNAFLSDYTGEEGGFWSTTAEMVELDSPIKEVTVTTTIDRNTVYPPQNVIFSTETPAGDNSNIQTNLIRFANFTPQPLVQNMQNYQILQAPPQQQLVGPTQQIVITDHTQQHQQLQLQQPDQHLATSGLLPAQYNETSSEEAYEIVKPRLTRSVAKSSSILLQRQSRHKAEKNIFIEEIKVEPLIDAMDFQHDGNETEFEDGNETGHEDPLSIKQEAGNAKERRAARKAKRLKNKHTIKKKGKRTRRPRTRICSQNCKYECGTHFDDEQRDFLCTEYWSMDMAERNEFLKALIETRKIKRIGLKKTDRPRREYSSRYHLRTAKGEQRRVCTCFFLATLCLTTCCVKKSLQNVEHTNQQTATTNTIVEGSIDNMTSTPERPKKPPAKQPAKNKGKKLDLSRKLRPANCEEVHCRFGCTSKMSETQRGEIWKAFWALDFKRRKDFLLAHVETHAVTTKVSDAFRKSDRPRSIQNQFYLRNEKAENVRVCSRFFLATLSLSSNYIRDTLRRTDPKTGMYMDDDKRGRREPSNKTSPELREDAKRHIESYATWAPNKRSKTRYLHSSLSIKKMFEEYKKKCEDEGRKFVNCHYYRKVFREEFRLGFLRPSVTKAQKAGTAKRNIEHVAAVVADKAVVLPKRFRLPNPYLSEYTGEEGGFWSSATNVIEIKQSTIPSSYEAPQNIVCSTATTETPSNFVRYTNFQQQSHNPLLMQNMHSLPMQQQLHQSQLHQMHPTHQQSNSGGLTSSLYDDQTPTVFRML